MVSYDEGKTKYSKTADPRSLISLEEGDTILDPIFNQITIIAKSFNNNILNIDLKSKSGIYTLKFKKA